jgi:hypothetical protein
MHATPVGTRLTTVRCFGALTALSSVSAVGTICAPMLLQQPFLLVLMTPRLPFLVIAAAHVPPLVLIPAAMARLCLGDVFHFRLGAEGAHQRLLQHPRLQATRLVALGQSVRTARPVTAVAERLRRLAPAARNGVLVAILVRPIGRHLMVAGAAGACGWRVAAADAVGTAAYVLVVVLGASTLA